MNNLWVNERKIYIIVIGKNEGSGMVLSMDNLAPYEKWELVLNFNAMFLLTNSIMVRKV